MSCKLTFMKTCSTPVSRLFDCSSPGHPSARLLETSGTSICLFRSRRSRLLHVASENCDRPRKLVEERERREICIRYLFCTVQPLQHFPNEVCESSSSREYRCSRSFRPLAAFAEPRGSSLSCSESRYPRTGYLTADTLCWSPSALILWKMIPRILRPVSRHGAAARRADSLRPACGLQTGEVDAYLIMRLQPLSTD